MDKNAKKCSVCNKRYAYLDLTPIIKKDLLICVECLEEKMEKGELPPLDQEGSQYIHQMLENLPKESKKEEDGAEGSSGTDGADLFMVHFGRDLTALAKQGKLDPVIGRDKEIERMILVLSRKGKNNPVLIGEPGVGKTANVEGLAQRIIKGVVPKHLVGKRIISLNIGSLVSGTKFRGEFEERMKRIIEEAAEHKEVILFLDEFHTIIGAGGAEGAVDASNLLKPALSRGELTMIGATTLDEYRKYVEKDAALSRRFQAIEVCEPTSDEAVTILSGLKTYYETFHNVSIEDEAIESAVTLSKKYVGERFLPDKAIDLLDEACAAKRVAVEAAEPNHAAMQAELDVILKEKQKSYLDEKFDRAREWRQKELETKKRIEDAAAHMVTADVRPAVVGREEIARVLEQWTGIPVTQMNDQSLSKLQGLETELKKEIKGQDEAVEMVARSVRRSMLKLKDPKRPAGVFLFLGPTGVGKTELAKALANLVFGTGDSMLQIDMSEFMEKHSVSKLIGAPPGYVGYGEEEKLVRMLRRKPYSLILFDEVEKAHPDVLNVMLQMFEDGRITDSKGRTVDAKNAIFILTSNAGSDVYHSGEKKVGFGTVQNEKTEQKHVREKVLARIKEQKFFRPEFMNRMDAAVVFNPLSEAVMQEIAEKFLSAFQKRAKESGYTVSYDPEVIVHLAKTGFAPECGARELRREVEKIGDLIGEIHLEENGATAFVVTVENGQLVAKRPE